MPLKTSFEKRIRRHLIGRTRQFFIQVAPGLEPLCIHELFSLPLSVKDIRVVTGGVELKGRLHDCYSANLNLRTAGRILMRVSNFRASNFRKLNKKLADIPWELYLNPGASLHFNITSKHSRLYHKEALKGYLMDSIVKSIGEFDPKTGKETNEIRQQIHVRILNDRFLISIDSSGNNLYKRNIKKHFARAPLRETTAAAILMMAGFHRTEPVLDPMCGSGTFSLESAMVTMNMPAGWFRTFSFETWPAFSKGRWRDIKKKYQKKIIIPKNPTIFASDTDKTACRSLKKSINEYAMETLVTVSNKDFFSIVPETIAIKKGLVVLNPPYGHRLGSKRQSKKMFEEICKKLKNDFKGWKLALVVPDKRLLNKNPFQMKAFSFLHGGLKLNLLVGMID